jgi:hypothetical protein
MKGFASRIGLAAGALAWFSWLPPTSQAATPLGSASVSSDVSVELSATTFDDEDVAVDNLLGVVVPTPLGAIPANADVTAYHLLSNGDQLFSLDTAVTLPGPLTAEHGDVVRYDGVSYSLEFDASAEGVPNGVVTNAVSQDGSGNLLLSFDITVDLGALTVDDEDLVGFDGANFSSVFDGSAAGVPDALDLDGAHDLGNGNLGLSFDGSGQLGGVDFDDEDVLEYDPSGATTWSLAYDGSALHSGWGGGADLDAVALPEPGLFLLLGSGIAGLLAIGRGRLQA